MADLHSRFRRGYKYTTLPPSGQAPSGWRSVQELRRRPVLWYGVVIVSAVFIGYLAVVLVRAVRVRTAAPSPAACDTPESGFQCNTAFSHSWGMYSPYFSVPSEIDAVMPQGCNLTFVQVLSRHGARDPTAGKTRTYGNLIAQIHSTVSNYGPGYEFIRDYDYTLGADELTAFGHQQMVNSGIQFYERYRSLANKSLPFVRSSGQNRVVESAQNWTQGFHQALLADRTANPPEIDFPYPILVIPEEQGMNNSLSHGLCTAFESGVYSTVGHNTQAAWVDVFAPGIADRLNANLPGMNLSAADVPLFMDLCPFNTVAASADGSTLSPFCSLFTPEEWAGYDYHASLGKWYGYGPGNPLGPTQGVGFANELVARLTGRPVVDRTSTNATLDGAADTFPLRRPLYVDFSHDNDMTSVLGALGLYGTDAHLLPNATLLPAERVGGYAASWTVPFAARIAVEKMVCGSESDEQGGAEEEEEEEEVVRVLVNDRVVPLADCGADALGRCTLDRFVGSLSFAQSGGRWDLCF